MAEVIGSAAYQLILDSTKFEKGAKLTRQESQALRRTLRDIETPAEKHQKKLDQLASLYRKGKLSAEQLRLGIDKLEQEYKQVTKASSQAATGQQNLEKSMISANLKTMALTKSIELARQALAGFISEAEEMDQIAKASAKLGVMTEDMVGLAHAAERMSGVSRGQFATALQRMTRRVAEAAQGTGEARKAIEELGLNAEELAKDPANAFLQIADAIRDVDNESDKLRLAFKFFDSEGAALVTTLDQGSEAIEEMQKRAEELGLTFNAAAAEDLQKFNDALKDSEARLEGIYRRSVIGLSPKLVESLDSLDQIIGSITGKSGGFEDALAAWYSKMTLFGQLTERYRMLTGQDEDFNNAMRALSGQVGTGVEARARKLEEEEQKLRDRRAKAKEKEEARQREIESPFAIDGATARGAISGGVAGLFSGIGAAVADGISTGMDWAEDQAAQEQDRRRQKAADEQLQKELDAQWKQFEKELGTQEQADEKRRQQWEKIGMGGVEQGSAEAFRLRREMNKKDEVQTVRLVPEQEDLLKTEVDVGVPIATGGIDINGVV